MGYLLKEALKTLCGVNQWSYAVFWKFGCQNPRLLIWEDYYYEPVQDYWNSAETSSSQSCNDKAQLLVSKMMMDNHVNIVGEGLVGRVAFTGNHQWILSDSDFIEAHPPEVLKQLGLQFAAGMQTVAVVPVLPHGVVQFGSYKKIMENMGFVNDVRSLILQLGHVPGVFQSENYAENELAPRIGVPVFIGNSTPLNPSLQSNTNNASFLFNSLNYVNCSAPAPVFDNPQSSVAGPGHIKPNNLHHEAKMDSALKFNFSPQNQIMNRMMPKAEVIPSNCEIWTKQHASSSQVHFSNFTNVSSGVSVSAERTNPGLNYCTSSNHVTLPQAEVTELCKGVMSSHMKPNSGLELKNVNLSKMDDSNPDSAEALSGNSTLTYSCANKNHQLEKFPQRDMNAYKDSKHENMAVYLSSFVEEEERKQVFGGQIHSANSFDNSCIESQSGDDLFDVLGADFKNKLLNNRWNSSLINESANKHNLDCGVFPSTCSDNLLDAVVSNVHPSAKQNLDDNVSCKTTLTNTSSSFTPMTSLPLSRFGITEVMKEELFGVPKIEKEIATSSYSFKNGSSKEDSGIYSQSSSIYGSQLNSWNAKQSNSVSNGYSKKADETEKTNRKRGKPGENPKPRPKDRQMIQDRVKELREIVPNGAKCSIDALLERTIKHMLFLQSVTKHADKLKQIGESKIISKDGGLRLKDDFEGGATWAYEVGSQSVVCPIIVEDLNQPRQLIVELLFEERGVFLEIADVIRGQGLTILKGIMETRNDKIWARFIVEADRDVTRMEIFLSLVRLLEQTAKKGVSQLEGMTSEHMMVQPVHETTSLPVAGQSCRLQ